jgi:hypothetical protein
MIRRGDYCHVPRKINKESKTAWRAAALGCFKGRENGDYDVDL